MPLNEVDQINLLKDILSNHQLDCCGSISEYEQLERLVKSLMVNEKVHTDALNVLEQIYTYSQNGIQAKNSDEHIESHQEQLSAWVSDMDQFS